MYNDNFEMHLIEYVWQRMSVLWCGPEKSALVLCCSCGWTQHYSNSIGKKIIGNCQIASTAYSLFSDIEIVHLEPTNVHGNIESIVRFVVASAHVAFVRRCWSRAWKGVRIREIDRWVESYLIHSQIIQTILAIHFRNFFYSSSS